MNFMNETIAALSTPKGTGAIAIVRLTGNESFTVTEKIFKGTKPIKQMKPRKAYHGKIIDKVTENTIDDVLVLKFKTPNSFTGQDMLEIHCHGGIYVVQSILNLLIKNGVKPAEPGEFSKRAFINGKLDLVQAESIADTIHAKSKASLSLSQRQLEGTLSKELTTIKNVLIKQCSLLELELDFCEEDVEFADYQTIYNNIDKLQIKLKKLIDSFHFGRLVREGVNLVITGKPNVGKSSLLNALIEQERAIVTDVPGTTRDTIEESIDINGYVFKLTDTAGLHHSNDKLENIGIERTLQKIKQADVVMLVIDCTKNEEPEFANMEKLKKKDALLLTVFNKIDLIDKPKIRDIENKYMESICLSAKQRVGFEKIEKTLIQYVESKRVNQEGEVLTKARHYHAVNKAYNFINNAKKSIKEGYSSEFVSLDLREALNSMSQLTGTVTTDDILNSIFSSFCIGK